MSGRSHGTTTDPSRVLAGLGSLTSVLLLHRVLIDFPQATKMIDQKLGAFLGLICALGIALAGSGSLGEQRMLARAASPRPKGVLKWLPLVELARVRALPRGKCGAGPSGFSEQQWHDW